MSIDSLGIMKAELTQLVQLLRPHYPEELGDELYARAMGMRHEVYAKGRWPLNEEIKQRKADVAAAAREKLNAEAWAAAAQRNEAAE
jgi:hypothetical protein